MILFFAQTYQYNKITFQMIVYNQYEDTVTRGSDPLKSGRPILPARESRSPLSAELASKMPHLDVSSILLIAAIVHLPDRPYGIITRLADAYNISRVSVYALGERVISRLAQHPTEPAMPLSLPVPTDSKESLKSRVDRLILTALFPGNASIRPTQAILKEALDVVRSVGYISTLRVEAGQKAGAILNRINYEPLGPTILMRDETFFQGWPMLLTVDPVTTIITSAQVTLDRKADTWAVELMEVQEQALSLAGLTEDMAKMYDRSVELAGIEDVLQQKDTWHLERDGGKVHSVLEKAAHGAITTVINVEKALLKKWDDALFEEKYIPAVAKEEQAIEQYDEFEEWLGHLCDALELVDLRSGEIREAAVSQWLLGEVITGMEGIEHKRVKKYAKTLRNHQSQLLTFLNWIAEALTEYDDTLSALIPDKNARLQFIQAVARSWKLNQTQINGHTRWKKEAEKAAALVGSLTDTDEQLAEFALSLRQMLDASGRTSSLIESINSLLKSFFRNRKGFKNQETMQAFLNLFVLWHNMRIYASRSKRGGKSPFQHAGIELENDDWLTLLGYLPAS
jgi:hypothetical protein